MEFLGKMVPVIVDRPLGSQHPHFEMEYPLNYGYLPHTQAGDGEEIDAYIIGVDQPVETFTGIVKALIIRKDDVENKLVVCPPEYPVSEEEIRQKTHFQEKYFTILVRVLEQANPARNQNPDRID